MVDRWFCDHPKGQNASTCLENVSWLTQRWDKKLYIDPCNTTITCKKMELYIRLPLCKTSFAKGYSLLILVSRASRSTTITCKKIELYIRFPMCKTRFAKGYSLLILVSLASRSTTITCKKMELYICFPMCKTNFAKGYSLLILVSLAFRMSIVEVWNIPGGYLE